MPIYLINSDDPRGQRVILYKSRFYEHIVSGHPSVTVESIRNTIENPDIITRDVKRENRDHYYAKGREPLFPTAYMKLSSKAHPNPVGFLFFWLASIAVTPTTLRELCNGVYHIP